MEILRGIQENSGMTLVIVTHENAIATSASRHIRIRDGRIEEERSGSAWMAALACLLCAQAVNINDLIGEA